MKRAVASNKSPAGLREFHAEMCRVERWSVRSKCRRMSQLTPLENHTQQTHATLETCSMGK